MSVEYSHVPPDVPQVDVDRQLKIQGRNERKFDLGARSGSRV